MDDESLPSEAPLPADLGPSQGSPMDVDDLLTEILLRLAPLPSSLPRASLVCTRWRRLVTDPDFLHRFRARHWKPLGVFHGKSYQDLSFSFTLGRGDAAPPARFSVRVPRDCDEDGGGGGGDVGFWELLGCRQGRVVLAYSRGYGKGIQQILVWNPVTGEDHLLRVPPFSDSNESRQVIYMHPTVICASGGDKGPFQVALAWDDSSGYACISVYSSETGAWGDVVFTEILSWFSIGRGNVLVGNTLYWLVFGGRVHILQLDLGSQKLSAIEVPRAVYKHHWGVYICTLGKGGGLSLIVMSENLRAHLWLREKTAGSDGVFQWIHGRTIELDLLLSLRSEGHRSVLWLDGDANIMFLSTYKGVFMVHLQSMQFEKIFETGPVGRYSIHAFTYDRYAPGDFLRQGDVGSAGIRGIGRGNGDNGADRSASHGSIRGGEAQADVAGLKQADALVSWEGCGPIW